MAAIAGANMWAFLRDNDPGHSADDAVVHGRKQVKKAAAKAEEVAPRAESVAAKPATKRGSKKGTKKATRGAAGGGKHKQAAPAGTMDDMMERFTQIAMAAIYGKQNKVALPLEVPAIPGLLPEHQPGGGQVKETPAAAAPSKEEEEEVVGIEWEYEEMGKVEEEGEFVAVVAKGGTVGRRARKAAVAEGIAATGAANMWAVLGDDDPGHGAAYSRKHKKAAAEVEEKIALADNVDGSVCSGSGDGGAKPAKCGKKTKKKKKCVIVEAEDSKQADTMDDGEAEAKAEDNNKQAVAVTVDNGKVTTQDNKLPSKGEMSEDEEEIAGGCRAVARAVVAAAVIALWCRLVSPF